jgi:4-hydroxybenzoyl-CoA thioesterase
LIDDENIRRSDERVAAPTTNSNPAPQAVNRILSIRFPQCDPAGIVFYPRYFEMVLQRFPDAPLATTPLAVKTRFLRPNRLGDTLELEFQDGEDWSVTGRMDGHDCFSMTPLDNNRALEGDAHLIPGAWSLGSDGRIHLSRYFEFLNMAIEEWFEDTLGVPFHELHVGRRIGIPTVQFDTRIHELPGNESTISTWIRPVKVGGRSMTFTSWLVADGQCVIENRQVIVFVEMQEGGYESMPIPIYIADAFKSRLGAGTEN